MAFRLAEAFVELKMRGEKELNKSLDKTKEKVKEVGPAADQAEKKIEKAATDAAKGVDKASTQMVTSLQKPIDKLAELEKEMKAKFDSLNKRAANLRQSQQPGGDLLGPNTLGPTNRIFGRFGGTANFAAAGAIAGIATAGAMRANELATTGEDSKILGPEVSRDVRTVVNGIKEVGSTFKDVAGGFIDGLLGFIAVLGNVVTFGGLGRAGEARDAEGRRNASNAAGIQFGMQAVRDMEAIDPYRPQRDAARRSELDSIFKRGGIEGLEREADRIAADMRTADAAKHLLQVNERIAQEKERAAKAGEDAAKAAEREAAAFRHAGQMATYAPERQLRIAEEAWRTGRPEESIDAERKFNLGPQDVALMEARMRGLDQYKDAKRTGIEAENFNAKAADRAAAMIDEGNAVARLRREYEALAARVAALPEGAGKEAAKAALAEAKMNVVAAEALDAEKRQNEAIKAQKQAELRAGADKKIDAIRQRFADLEFATGNKPRDTTSFQQVSAPDFAKLIQSDIFAKEDEQKRVEDAKQQHEEAQKLRQQQVDEIKGVRDELEKGLKAVAG